MREEWREIHWIAGYWVSSYGRVKSDKRGTEKLMKQHPDRYGYMRVQLYLGEGRRKTIRIHRLVGEAFLGPSDLPLDHLDGNPANNRLDNLEYVTIRENTTRGIGKADDMHCICTRDGGYRVRVGIGKKRIGCGTYKSVEDAKWARDYALWLWECCNKVPTLKVVREAHRRRGGESS